MPTATTRISARIAQPLAVLSLVAGLLAGCASVPDLGPRPVPRDATSLAGAGPANGAPADPAGHWPAEDWWRAYGDAQLTALIEEAIKDSPDLAAAEARFHKADGYARTARAALLPSAEVDAQAGETKQSYNEGFPPQYVPHGWHEFGAGSLDLSYEIDFFGRNRAALRAATSERQATAIEAHAARLALATSVAEAYAELGRSAASREVRVAALRVREETASLVRHRVTIGLDNLAVQRQAESAVPAARADLASADEALELARHRIAALMGAAPERAATILPPPPGLIPAIAPPTRLAFDLVGRRADIAAARARVEAAAARIKVARSAFYPNVNLLAFVGAESLGFANLTALGSEYGQAGAAVSLPLFEGGRLSGNLRSARGDYDEAVALYDATLVRALQDVADAATAQRALARELTATREATSRSEEAWHLARRRYDGGLSGYLAVLTAEDAYLRNRQTQAELEARTLTVNVELIRALGGGFGQV